MGDWTAGYMADIDYTYGYYAELNPTRIAPAFLAAGLLPPRVETACELGFGQGVAVNIHAAAGTAAWYGTDFNPAHAGFAKEMAGVAGAGASLCDDAFADFAQRHDLPDFDFIALHGIWSWISEANRAAIIDFVRRRLKVGGVLYISYNTQPGWASFAPARHLLSEHAAVFGAPGQGILDRVDGALDFVDRLLATKPKYALANPHVVERIRKIRGQNRHYLAHEYFNRVWQPMHFAEMERGLAEAKLDFACSANYADLVDSINLTQPQQEFLRRLSDAGFRETVRDFMVNQQFRRDYWVKGARRLSSPERGERQRLLRVMLGTHRPDVVMKVDGALGECGLDEAVFVPLLDLLADHVPRTIGEIAKALHKKVGLPQILQACLVLAAANHIHWVQDDELIVRARDRTTRINAWLLERACFGGDIGYLASPVTGGGVAVGRFQQLFLRARAQGVPRPKDWAHAAWLVLSGQGQKLVKEGKSLETPEENMAELCALAESFARTRLPILQAFGIV